MTEHEMAFRQVASFFCGLCYLSTEGFWSEELQRELPWYFHNGVMSDVAHCFQWAGMA